MVGMEGKRELGRRHERTFWVRARWEIQRGTMQVTGKNMGFNTL